MRISDWSSDVCSSDLTLQPIQPLQSQICEHCPGDSVIAEALQSFGLQRQDVPLERRYSYYCGEAEVSDELKQAIEKLGCDLLYSAGLYLDILPRGVNTGATLKRLVEHLSIDPERVLVAGDTLNDLAMYQQPFKGVRSEEHTSELQSLMRTS